MDAMGQVRRGTCYRERTDGHTLLEKLGGKYMHKACRISCCRNEKDVRIENGVFNVSLFFGCVILSAVDHTAHDVSYLYHDICSMLHFGPQELLRAALKYDVPVSLVDTNRFCFSQ